MRLLQVLVLATISDPFGDQLTSRKTGVAVDYHTKWSGVAIELAVARGPNPPAIAPYTADLVHKDIDYQVKVGFTEIVVFGMR